jgi:plasmid stabilization system protein ParE
VRYSKTAYRDLSSIHRHVERSSPANAARLVSEIMDAIDGLQLFPNRNIVESQQPPKKGPVRSLPVLPYMIFFRVEDKTRIIRILRIRHGARKPIRKFD